MAAYSQRFWATSPGQTHELEIREWNHIAAALGVEDLPHEHRAAITHCASRYVQNWMVISRQPKLSELRRKIEALASAAETTAAAFAGDPGSAIEEAFSTHQFLTGQPAPTPAEIALQLVAFAQGAAAVSSFLASEEAAGRGVGARAFWQPYVLDMASLFEQITGAKATAAKRNAASRRPSPFVAFIGAVQSHLPDPLCREPYSETALAEAVAAVIKPARRQSAEAAAEQINALFSDVLLGLKSSEPGGA